MLIKKMPKNLSGFKRLALFAGTSRIDFQEFSHDSRLGNTNFAAGKFMEVVMAWMLGYFRTVTLTYLKIEITEVDDKVYGIDFYFKAPVEVAVDMKFDKDEKDDKSVSSYRREVVRTYPVLPGKSSSKKVMTGAEALRSILFPVLGQDVDKMLAERPYLVDTLDKIWDHYSKGW